MEVRRNAIQPGYPYISAVFPCFYSTTQEARLTLALPCVGRTELDHKRTFLIVLQTSTDICLTLMPLAKMEVGKGAVSSEEEGQIVDDEEENTAEKPEEEK